MATTPKPQKPFAHGGEDNSPFRMLKYNDEGKDNGFILKTRSLDEASPHKRKNEPLDFQVQTGDSSNTSALHCSFDASLLRDDSEKSSVCGYLFEDDEADSSFGDLSGKKHLRQKPTTETLEVNPPGTVRKQPRTGIEQLDSKTPSRPRIRPPGALKKPASSTPSSAAKRRRAPLPQRQSPMRRVPPTTPFQGSGAIHVGRKLDSSLSGVSFVSSPQAQTPNRPFGATLKSISKWHHTGTTAATHLETTFESDSVDTSSPNTTRFRFTSFPASLPRVNNPRTRQCPESLRKRMSFGEGDPNQSRDDDAGTHNTSISSLSGDGGPQTHLPLAPGSHPPAILELGESHTMEADDEGPEHGQLFPDEENFGYSEDESSNGDSPARDVVGRTRLNFNMLLSPGKQEDEKTKDQNPKIEQEGKTLMPLDLNMELIRPYDQQRMNSFQSSLSSNTNQNTLSGCEEGGSSSTPGRVSHKERPSTPREVKMHFALESECSPIPPRSDPAAGSILNPDVGLSEGSGLEISDGFLPQTAKSIKSASDSQKDKSKEDESATSMSTDAKSRRRRPMPDMSAFEKVATGSRGDRSSDDSATLDSKGLPSSQRLLCPPTPVRTPAWANEGGHPAFHRQNSLIATKVLLSVPTHVVEGRTSLESSVLDDDSKASGRKFGSRIAHKQGQPIGGTEVDEVGEIVTNSRELACMLPPVPCFGALGFAKTSQVRITAPPKVMRRVPSANEEGEIVSFANDFEILRVLGSGTFADVYKVRSVSDNRLYAVKRNRRQFRGKRDRDIALGEVQSMQRLQSVCAETGKTTDSSEQSYCLYLLFFYRAWQEDGYFFCQTELCCRDTCRELLDALRFEWSASKNKYPSLRRLASPDKIIQRDAESDTGRLVPGMTVWKICHDIAAGLSHIHRTGLVHQDLKPSNIFFVANARFGAMCKIGDFGMAGEIGSSGDGLEGDARYMPPELLSSGSRRPSSDIFSLGLTLYEIATDEHIEMPSEGPQWHEFRSANGPNLPACRDVELTELIQAMTNPDENKRPSADTILKNQTVISAGHGCDNFLRDYIHDIEEYDRMEDERLAMDRNDDRTPRNGSHRATNFHARSPSLSMIIPTVPTLLSPVAHTLHS